MANDNALYIEVIQRGKRVFRQKFSGFIYYNHAQALQKANDSLKTVPVNGVESYRSYITMFVVPHKRKEYIEALTYTSAKNSLPTIKFSYND